MGSWLYLMVLSLFGGFIDSRWIATNFHSPRNDLPSPLLLSNLKYSEPSAKIFIDDVVLTLAKSVNVCRRTYCLTQKRRKTFTLKKFWSSKFWALTLTMQPNWSCWCYWQLHKVNESLYFLKENWRDKFLVKNYCCFWHDVIFW